MNHFMIGEQIQKFRKEAGLTQKELGEALGISSSAVSQWETGGTPDISLLPALADRLGVSIDALFGREEVTRENMDEALPVYLASLPESKRLEESCRLMCKVMKSLCMDFKDRHTGNIDISGGFQFRLVSDQGIMAGSMSEKMPFAWIFPEPEQGYAAALSSNDEYRRLFGVLSRPHALELLRLLYQRPPRHCTADVIVKRLGIDGEETRTLLAEFAGLELVQELDLETEKGDIKVYNVNDCGGLVPFLCASQMMFHSQGSTVSRFSRKEPLLKK